MLHHPCRNDGPAESAEQTDKGCAGMAIADHRDQHHEAHAEGRTEIGQRDELVFFEIRCERAVFRKRDDGWIVRKKGHDGPERRDARQIEERFHQRPQDLLQQRHNAEFCHQLGKGSRQDRDAHQVKDRVEQQVVGGVHDRFEHVARAHPVAQDDEDGCQECKENDRLDRRPVRGFHYFRNSCEAVIAFGSNASSNFSWVISPCSSTRSYTLRPVSRASLATFVEAL